MRCVRVQCAGVCLLLLAAAAVVADGHAAGKWVLAVDLGDGQGGDATFEIKQDGETLSGTYSGALGEAELMGEAKGDEVEFSFSSDAGKVTYKGTVSGDTMEGTCEYGQLGSGTFKGKKQG